MEPGIDGETTSFTEEAMTLSLPHPLPLRSDVKLQLDFCAEAHCFNPVYAKVTSTETKERHTIHHLRITSIDPEDQAILQQWRNAAT
jgi:hypothetical protein